MKQTQHQNTYVLLVQNQNDDHLTMEALTNAIKTKAFSLMNQGKLPANLIINLHTENFPHSAHKGSQFPVLNCDATVTASHTTFYPASSFHYTILNISLKELSYQ